MVKACARTWMLCLCLAACGPVAEAPEAEEAAETAEAPAGAEAEDRGDLKVVYAKIENPDYQEIETLLQEVRLLEDTVAELNTVFALPADVPVVLRECGEVNAFYDPNTREISLCYEMVEDLMAMFMAEDQTDEEAEAAGAAVAGATIFAFYHELGHALIDLYDLPVTGREEDAVDQLATMILLEGGEEGEAAALDGASSFLSEEEQELDDLAFWDEHSLDDQRFYNIVCWSYGKNPEGFQDLVDDGTLPEERAEQCPAEYERMSRSWSQLLEPHVKG